ncbi:MAG TPA: hypothetical protein VJZ71_09420 [Phycisphaerae bacterium]|nr:hypothetical protein [Phycisphaerae bacterium]
MPLATSDLVALALFVLGILFQFSHRRMPPGLGASLFVGAVSVGVTLVAYGHRGTTPWNLPTAGHLCATLSLIWAGLGWMAAKRSTPEPSPTSSATFFAWALVAGIVAAILTLNHLTALTWTRVLDVPRAAARVADTGVLWDIAALLGAVLLWAAAGPRPQQPVLLLVLCAFAVWWSSLRIHPFLGASSPVQNVAPGFGPVWWNWIFQMQLGLTTVLIVAAVLQDLRFRSRRNRAWPDRLDDLLEPYSLWPLFIQIEAFLAAVILVLGVYQIVQFAPPVWPHALAAAIVSAAAGTTCVFMTYRRWSANTAGLGMSLLSLAAVLLFCVPAALFTAPRESTEYAARIPALFNAILFALALMIAWWRWLAKVWNQQLLDNVPWTTAGRMIPYSRRTAFILSALAMLLAFEMALWPLLVAASESDDSIGRIVAGLVAIGLLTAMTLRYAAREASGSSAALSVALLAAGIIFLFVRMPAPVLRGWILQHLAVVLAALAVPALLVSESLGRHRWRSFAAPLWWLALLVLPAAAISELLSREAPPAEWVQPTALALLGALYCLAGRREHRRAFLVLGAVLLIASLTSVYRGSGRMAWHLQGYSLAGTATGDS